ncbi:hypothetical protein ACJJTC_011257 [Scirpophaga incertulas]
MPFAVTSAKYRAMFKEQIMKKELEIKAKEEKKKETKLQKEKEKIEKTKSANRRSQADSRNACKVCSQVHVPEDLRIDLFHRTQKEVSVFCDLFICHCCYNEDNYETLDLSSEKNSEDSGDDSQTLYDMIIE